MIYGYVRVSSITQNIDRQWEDMRQFGIVEENIYVDYQSGKDFERVNYQKLIQKMQKDDLLVIKSIDRLGRNYQAIVDEWAFITKHISADILVLDMPLLDTRSSVNSLVSRFISDIVLQLLSFVAENERDNIRKRQAEGIRIAKEKGKQFGRPKLSPPPEFALIKQKYQHRLLSGKEVCLQLGISRGTFYRFLQEC